MNTPPPCIIPVDPGEWAKLEVSTGGLAWLQSNAKKVVFTFAIDDRGYPAITCTELDAEPEPASLIVET